MVFNGLVETSNLELNRGQINFASVLDKSHSYCNSVRDNDSEPTDIPGIGIAVLQL